MRKMTLSLLMVFAIGMIYGVTNTAFAYPNITSRHLLVTETEVANRFEISLLFALKNSGTESLNDVVLEITDPTLPAEPGTNKLYLDSLPPETQLQVTWKIISSAPFLAPGLPLLIQGNGTDINGQSVNFHITSEGV